MAAPRHACAGRVVSLAILVVEDEAVNRTLLRAVLGRHPVLGQARLVEAPTLAAAREATGTETFDLCILDVRLPDGDGLVLANELRDAGAATPVIVLSANVSDDHRRRAAEAGAVGFVGKPYRPAVLVEEIERVLGPTARPR